MLAKLICKILGHKWEIKYIHDLVVEANTKEKIYAIYRRCLAKELILES